MYCESDQASLCWDCDEKVHSANFLVAKHSRCLLCRVCQSLTPWKASGPKLAPTVSVCEACVITATRCGVNDDDKTVRRENQSDSTSGHDETDDEDDYHDEEDDDDDLDEEEEEEENQVVPWSGDSQSSSPPAVSTSSCSGIGDEDVSLKRMRDFDLFSDVSLRFLLTLSSILFRMLCFFLFLACFLRYVDLP